MTSEIVVETKGNPIDIAVNLTTRYGDIETLEKRLTDSSPVGRIAKSLGSAKGKDEIKERIKHLKKKGYSQRQETSLFSGAINGAVSQIAEETHDPIWSNHFRNLGFFKNYRGPIIPPLFHLVGSKDRFDSIYDRLSPLAKEHVIHVPACHHIAYDDHKKLITDALFYSAKLPEDQLHLADASYVTEKLNNGVDILGSIHFHSTLAATLAILKNDNNIIKNLSLMGQGPSGYGSRRSIGLYSDGGGVLNPDNAQVPFDQSMTPLASAILFGIKRPKTQVMSPGDLDAKSSAIFIEVDKKLEEFSEAVKLYDIRHLGLGKPHNVMRGRFYDAANILVCNGETGNYLLDQTNGTYEVTARSMKGSIKNHTFDSLPHMVVGWAFNKLFSEPLKSDLNYLAQDCLMTTGHVGGTVNSWKEHSKLSESMLQAHLLGCWQRAHRVPKFLEIYKNLLDVANISYKMPDFFDQELLLEGRKDSSKFADFYEL